ncbi:hypothetical protein D6745_00880 [Candidatus Woesearchaeota archaeon]|nr:MAG: hypothetical protein D6745_00880 [Candidatus Woesearchaeota archaeon]
MTKSLGKDNPFAEFLGQEIKAPYRDGDQYKVARGRLEQVGEGFIKVVGELGTIIINTKNVEKMSRVKRK